MPTPVGLGHRGMPKIGESSHGTLNQIELAVLARAKQEQRPHLGASVLGYRCERRVQFTFRWAYRESFPARILRLFKRGEREEAVFVDLLRDAHILVWETDSDGEQFGFKDGHFAGSIDGFAARLPEAPQTVHLLEFKTHGEKSFKTLTKAQSIAKSHPQHYVQVQVYMHALHVTRTLYLAVNKNTDALYMERVRLDKEFATYQNERAQMIIAETRLMPPISSDPSWYECKMCPFHPVCHENVPLQVSCRTCTHAQARRDGTWFCNKHKNLLTIDHQREACNDHEPFDRD